MPMMGAGGPKSGGADDLLRLLHAVSTPDETQARIMEIVGREEAAREAEAEAQLVLANVQAERQEAEKASETNSQILAEIERQQERLDAAAEAHSRMKAQQDEELARDRRFLDDAKAAFEADMARRGAALTEAQADVSHRESALEQAEGAIAEDRTAAAALLNKAQEHEAAAKKVRDVANSIAAQLGALDALDEGDEG